MTCVDCGKQITRYAQRCKSCSRKGAGNGRFGRIASDETRAKISARLSKPNGRDGENHPMWKGDTASKHQGRSRAERLFPSQPCAVCGVEKTERHHVDGNTLNNDPSNVMHLCRPHHRRIHPGNGRRPLRPPSELYAGMSASRLVGDAPMFVDLESA